MEPSILAPNPALLTKHSLPGLPPETLPVLDPSRAKTWKIPKGSRKPPPGQPAPPPWAPALELPEREGRLAPKITFSN